MSGSGHAEHCHRDDRLFERIDTEEKAYLLGWITGQGGIGDGTTVRVTGRVEDNALLKRLRDVTGSANLRMRRRGRGAQFPLPCDLVAPDVRGWLEACRDTGPSPGALLPDAEPSRPALCIPTDPALSWAFMRGWFDRAGSLNAPGPAESQPRCRMRVRSRAMRDAVRELSGMQAAEGPEGLEWSGNNALDFLARLYERASIYLPRHRDLYRRWTRWVPSLSGPDAGGPLFRWMRADPRAAAPFKERASDSGFDLTLIERVKAVGRAEMYTTGIKIEPAYGWYFDLVPRSSIIKTGYIVGNSIGVIDRSYRGPVMVPLIKVDESAPDLPLPARVVQIIPRPIIHGECVEVSAVEETCRGEGGFGSTGG